VIILDEIFAALSEWRGDCRVALIHAVKFLAALKPEQQFTIRLSPDNEAANEVTFCCRVEDRVIVEGRLQICRNGS
jgi:hypothetical protein